MSGIAFNPMRKTPPPPPYIDTVSFNPEEYISVEPNDGPLFLVSRECLRVSPFIRRAFDKRANIFLEDIEIIFYNRDNDSDEEEDVDEGDEEDTEEDQMEMHSGSNKLEIFTENSVQKAKNRRQSHFLYEDSTKPQESSHFTSQPSGTLGEDSVRMAIEDRLLSTAEVDAYRPGEIAGSGRKKQETIFPEDPLYAIPKVPRPFEVLKEALQNNKMVIIRFPKLKSAMLEVVVAYLYFKYRYDGRATEPRDPFSVPLPFALDIVKLASLLEC